MSRRIQQDRPSVLEHPTPQLQPSRQEMEGVGGGFPFQEGKDRHFHHGTSGHDPPVGQELVFSKPQQGHALRRQDLQDLP